MWPVPRLALADLRPGDRLNSPAHSARGVLLAPAETVLNETHRALFASWGVADADIVGRARAEGDESRPLDPRRVEAIGSLLDERFSLVQPLTPFLSEARRVALAETQSLRLSRAVPHAAERDGKRVLAQTLARSPALHQRKRPHSRVPFVHPVHGSSTHGTDPQRIRC